MLGRTSSASAFDPTSITRPAPQLLTYYIIMLAITVVGLPILILPMYFRYHTMRFAFDDKGVSMSWGLLFRREIYLTYRRIQDIHVSRNIIQRWLGLANVSVQTASGAAGAEMTIEGILQPEALRDFLYAQMRGARGDDAPAEPADAAAPQADEAIVLLREIRDALRARGGAAAQEGPGP